MEYFRRKKILRQSNYLDLTPFRRYSHKIEEDGTLSVLFPKFTGWLSRRIIQPYVKHPNISISLDELGSATWLLCDGKTNVRSICNALKKQFGEKIHPAEERVTKFLSQLYKDNVISFKEIQRQS
jgi:hypothetical protein